MQIILKRLAVNESATTVIQTASQMHTTGSGIANIPVSDAILTGQIATLQQRYTGFKQTPPTFTKNQVTTSNNIVIVSYNKNMSVIESAANDKAISAGDVTAGNTLAESTGAKFAKKGVPAPKSFSADSKIEGQIDVKTKSPKAGCIFIRQYGPTVKGTPPAVAVIAELLISKKSKISITNLKSVTCYGIREAIILPTPKKKKVASGGMATQKLATHTPTTDGSTDTFSDGEEHYKWSDWIYPTCK
ncbi:MAG TPA: hypothetical protein VF411_13930 [Bacteroidia bacterium]